MSEDNRDRSGEAPSTSYDILKTLFGITTDDAPAAHGAGPKAGSSIQPSHKGGSVPPGSDEFQAAMGLEWERQGCKVSYVLRGSLLQDGSFSEHVIACYDTDKHVVQLVVDDPQQVARLQRQMRERPERFREALGDGRREVASCLQFERDTDRALLMPFRQSPKF